MDVMVLEVLFKSLIYDVLQGPRQDSYRYAVTPGDEGGKKSKKGKKKAEMDDLKQELTMDEHKIPITELYSRLSTDPNTVWAAMALSLVILLYLRVDDTYKRFLLRS